MKKIYWIGDIKNNTGPANVNKKYKEFLSNEAVFCNSNNKTYRIFHFLVNIPFKKIIIISGFSKLNYIFLKISNILNKKTFYLMHGYLKIESKYNKNITNESKNIEQKILKESYKIICVSKMFANIVKQEYPEINSKITYVNNGTNNKNKKETKTNNKTNKYCIISVGGGLKQKNNLDICKAINEINDNNIKLIIIGKIGNDGEKIKKYPFVEYHENLSHEEVLNLMGQANLYIQNSYFETFGLAIIEALQEKCNILISKNIGAIDILDNINDKDIIYDNESVSEIKEKILNKKEEKETNIKIKRDSTWEKSSKKILDIIWM